MKRAALALLLVLAASQLALPELAEDRLRSELSETGEVTSVQVSAFPALKLLFEKADSVRVRMSSASVGVGDLGDRLASTDRAGEVDFEVAELSLGPLAIRDVSLMKDGDALEGSASLMTDSLPLDLEPVLSDDGALVFEAGFAGITARARLSDSDGALVIAPDGLLGGFASITVFEDPRVSVDGVTARPYPDGFTVVANATLRPQN